MIFVKIFLISLTLKSVYSFNCVGCTSDNGSNKGCEEHPEDQPSIPCTGDKDRCYVRYVKQKDGKEMWNRACCKMKPDAVDCPSNEPDHIVESSYELWRVICEEDNCNIMDPSDRGDGGGGVVIVHGGNGSAPVAGKGCGMATLLVFVSVLFRF